MTGIFNNYIATANNDATMTD